MANSRIARLFMEVAPPQYISVMRHRTSKMLDTINEEEKEINSQDSIISSSSSSPTKLSSSVSGSGSGSVLSTASASATIIAAPNSKYFLKEVHRSLSTLNN
ncbi:hypothetical protein Lal_00029709 [Lupinus albus]|uniref:Uncharacterized protein n=1 Tax=Lupinus albus TaxID=3870 RepID=A0A6A5MN02_LUPAL|nr:hypothetical protein Lalb_Chr07g0187521 [Lupinus albus]KAF1876361.1 hypothetical protein Lal_00029709 [Lupinus albus]